MADKKAENETALNENTKPKKDTPKKQKKEKLPKQQKELTLKQEKELTLRHVKPSRKGKSIAYIITAMILTYLAFLFLTPLPSVLRARLEFSKSPIVAEEEELSAIDDYVNSQKDVSYESIYPRGKMDIYTPKEISDPLPLVMWVAGSGYVGGDKSDAEFYCKTLAKEGFVVVSLNYNRAPEGKYPEPLIQIGEAYEFLDKNSETFKLNPSEVYIAGNSSGAQIAAQFITVQTSHSYSLVLKMKQTIPKERIKGAFLYCGSYDLESFTQAKGSANEAFGFDFDKIGWSYFGDPSWKNSDAPRQASITQYVNGDFPPCLIVDSGKGSFRPHGDDLSRRLIRLNVNVRTMLFLDDADISHNFQFNVTTEEGRQVLEQTKNFLRILAKY